MSLCPSSLSFSEVHSAKRVEAASKTLGETVVRIRPRWNPEVNRYFMCDVGRAEYKKMAPAERVLAPSVFEDGNQKAVPWDVALAKAATIISGSGGRAVALVSPSASTESLFLLKEALSGLDFIGAFRAPMGESEVPLAGMESLALRKERAPNAAGARMLGYTDDFDSAVKAIDGASVLVILDEQLVDVPENAVNGAANVIFVGSVLSGAAGSANVVLPSAMLAEADGCYVNRDGRVQRFHKAKAPPGLARPGWQAFSELISQLDRGDAVKSAAAAFALLAQKEEAFRGLSYERIGKVGQKAQGGGQ